MATSNRKRRSSARPHPTLRAAVLAAGVATAAIAALWLPKKLLAAEFWVGSSGPCTHATVGAALTAALANGPTADTIRLTGGSAHYPLTAPIVVSDDDITIVGGYGVCGNLTPSVNRAVLDVTGAADAFRVFGATPSTPGHLRLDTVTVAMDPGSGRALKIEANGSVEVYSASIASGHATDGGNIHLSGAGSLLEVRVNSNVVWGEADPGDGGGIYCEAGGQVVLESGSQIGGNLAQQSGGGIYLDDCDLTFTTWIEANPVPHGYTDIYENQATVGNGGGIAAVNGATVHAVGSHPDDPARISSNYANGTGGGIYAEGLGTEVFLTNGDLWDNRATGAGGGVSVASGALFEMDQDPIHCRRGRDCSRIRTNFTYSYGGGLVVGAGSTARVLRTAVTENYTKNSSGGAALAAIGAGANLLVEGAVIYNNDPNSFVGVESSRIASGSSASATVAFTTIVEETTSAATAVFENANAVAMSVQSSIVQASHTFTAVPPATQVRCAIVREAASLPAGSLMISTIVDPALIFRLSQPDDYALFQFSEAEEFCNTSTYTPTRPDLDGQTRGYDDPDFANILGPYDVGADEWRPEVFGDGFESGDSSGW